MAVNHSKAKITYDGDGQLKLVSPHTYPGVTISSENGEWFLTRDEDNMHNANGVIYALETDNYAAAVLEYDALQD